MTENLPVEQRGKDSPTDAPASAMRRYYRRRGAYAGPYIEYQRAVVCAASAANNFRLLDIGCGRSFPMASHWVEAGAEVYGIDPMAESGRLPSGATLAPATADDLPFEDGFFDAVVSRAVLEHLSDPVPAFQEISRVLAPHDVFIAMTPSKYDYVSLFARILPNRVHGAVVRLLEGRAEEDTFPTYYRANSARQLRALCRQAGMETARVAYLDQSPYAFRKLGPLYALACGYHALVRRIRWLNALQGWILLVARKPGLGDPDEVDG